LVLAGLAGAGSWLALKQVGGDQPPSSGVAEKRALVSRQQGGVIALADGTSVCIPPGALPADTMVTLCRLTNPAPGGRAVTLTRIDIGGVTLASPATLRLPCPTVPAGEEGTYQIQVYRIHGGQRTQMPCFYDPSRQFVEVRTRQFSDWEASWKDRRSDVKGEKARGQRDYRTFFGLDDTHYPPETQASRYVGMRDALGNAILDYQMSGQLDTKDPTAGRLGAFGHALAAPNGAAAVANFLGSDLGTLIRDKGPPDDLAEMGNYYAKFTRVAERELRQKVLASGGNLTPADIMKMALEATGGNYPTANLTAHNFLKNVAYKGRGSTSGPGILVPTSGDEYVVDVASKLVNLRGDPSKADKLGPWYHMFGLLFLGSITGKEFSRHADHFEQWSRTWSDSPVDPGKAEWDRAALMVIQRVHPQIYGGRPAPNDGPAEPELPAGALRVQVEKLVDEATREPVSGATVEVSFVGKKEALRQGRTVDGQVVFGSLPGQFGHYQVHVSLKGYTPVTQDVELLFEKSATITVTLKPAKEPAKEVVWVLKEGYPQLRPEPSISLKAVEESRTRFGIKYECWENIITAADRLSAHYKYEDTHARHTIIDYRFDFQIKFEGGVPKVLKPGEKYWVTLSGKTTGRKEPGDAWTLGDHCFLKAEADGLDVKQVKLGVGESSTFPEDKPNAQVRCPFWLVDNPPSVIVMDFVMPSTRIVGKGSSPRLVRYVYERQEK
jgi:hypothetical protein